MLMKVVEQQPIPVQDQIKKICVIVVDYPKATETFIMRDLMVFHNDGVDVRLHHLATERDDILHDFAKPTRGMARYVPFVGSKSLGALARAVIRKPLTLAKTVGQIVWAYRTEPGWMAKTLALVPKALAIGEDVKAWGAEHVHGEFAGHPGAVAWIIGRMQDLPYSVSCRAHDIFRTQALLNHKLGEAAFVRTISKFNKTFLMEQVSGLDASRIHVIHSSVDLTQIPALPAPQNDRFRIVYVGSLQERKGVDVLLKALAKAGPDLGDWHCDIIGTGPIEGELKALAGRLGLERVTFRGGQPFEEVSRAMARASVCVAPSVIGPQGRTEGIPNVMIEALAHQRPAISSNVSGIPELLQPGRTGWLTEPGDVDGLAAALKEIHDDPETAYRYAVAGRQLVAEEFDILENAREQIRLFSQYRAAR